MTSMRYERFVFHSVSFSVVFFFMYAMHAAGPRDTPPEVASSITYDMSPETGLPPLVFQNGRWELDTSQWASSLPVRDEAKILAANERRSKGKKQKEGRPE